jgi:hypothetical protein
LEKENKQLINNHRKGFLQIIPNIVTRDDYYNFSSHATSQLAPAINLAAATPTHWYISAALELFSGKGELASCLDQLSIGCAAGSGFGFAAGPTTDCNWAAGDARSVTRGMLWYARAAWLKSIKAMSRAIA